MLKLQTWLLKFIYLFIFLVEPKFIFLILFSLLFYKPKMKWRCDLVFSPKAQHIENQGYKLFFGVFNLFSGARINVSDRLY